MGARRFELRTSPLSGVRSSQLSYAPNTTAMARFIVIGLALESTVHRPKHRRPANLSLVSSMLISSGNRSRSRSIAGLLTAPRAVVILTNVHGCGQIAQLVEH